MNSDIVIRNLNVSFAGSKEGELAIANVHAVFPGGSVTGLIGESGSGKSVLGMSILGLLPPSAVVTGECLYKGKDLYQMDEKALCALRGNEIALIPQNPSESLNPILRIGGQLTESMKSKGKRNKHWIVDCRDRLLRRFGFDNPDRINRSYTFQLSGGMNQRVICTLGLINAPKWVIADEPTKGLDAILRRQVYETLKDIASKETEGMIVITHDIALASGLCDRLMVIYKGTVLEQGKTDVIMNRPAHPYTQGLIASLPRYGMNPIPGNFPDREESFRGCRFYPRCPRATKICSQELPPETNLPDNRIVRCFHHA